MSDPKTLRSPLDGMMPDAGLEELTRAAQRLAIREQQQAAVASLGLRALEETDLQAFMEHAAREVQRTLEIDIVKILELQPGGQRMLLRAGVGWSEGLVGSATLTPETDAQAAYTLRTQSPVIVEDLTLERRFVAPGVLLDHNVRSGISCIIRDGDGAYGVLGTHSHYPRNFRREDTDFIVAVAAVITAAVNRHQTLLRLALENAMARAQMESTSLTDAAARIHSALAEPLGASVGELWQPVPGAPHRVKRTVLTVLPPFVRTEVEEALHQDTFEDGSNAVRLSIRDLRAQWLSSTQEPEAFPRVELVKRLGLQSGLIIPISVAGTGIAVLTVFSHRRLHANDSFLRGLEAMGRGLGEFVRRREMESRAAWLAAITASAQDAVISHDFEGKILGWLEGAQRLYGYTQDEVLGRSIEMIIPSEHRSDVRAAVARLRRGEIIQPFETVRTCKDGSSIHVSVSMAGIRDEGGSVIAISVTDRDVTKQRRANEALSASERRFRATFENAAVGMAHVSLNGQWLRVNDRLLATLGYSREDLLQRTFQSITHPEHVERDTAQITALVEGRVQHYTTEKRYVRADGSFLWANVTVAVVRSSTGKAEYFITVIEDIEQRKRAVAELRASESRFRQMVVHSPVPLMVFDDTGTIVALSRSWTELSGYRAEQLPNVEAWVRHAYREGASGTGESVQIQWQQDDAIEPTERDIWTATGERKTLLIRTVPLGDSEQSHSLRICAAADITAQKQAARELIEAGRQKDEFLAMLSHELRNPLSAVRSATELIKLVRSQDPDLARPIAVLERHTAHIAKLLDGLLDLSRVIRGAILLERTVLDLRRTIQDVTGDFAETLHARGILLIEDLPQDPVWLDADPVRMTQVVDNLLSNAVKYTGSPGTISVELSQDDAVAVLTVTDTGIGIEADLLPHVFDTFRQGEQNLDRSQGGLGLGLALVKTLVERHHGTVAAHSRGAGQGSQFIVTLPLSRGPRVTQTSSPAPAADPLPRVLIVEDNEDAAEMLEQALRIRGYETQLASYGQQAIEMSLRDTFDVVLCDVGLPMGMSGFDVARQLRQDPRTQHLKLVALTGYGTPEDRRTSEEAGFDTHLTKPVDFRLLTKTLSELFPGPAGA